ncbi:dephospho-CoA kinase [Candidatus Formimonas warabiya]|uniref:dephospho-CoA kinase n=1 Tax=Formimonas warabiya TaxID=1761012 RepID=UPI0011D121F6|nr:dephospho-CoA kinase [Candidatus Formimonas warabiya]
MKIIGLTGGIASGKSTVSSVLKELGALIIDADKVAREIVLPGSPAWNEIVQEFGQAILQPDQNINRKELAGIIFRDQAARNKLNRITHPRIMDEIRKRINAGKRGNNYLMIVVDAPLLIELGMTAMVDEVWLTALPKDIQIMRLMEREGLPEWEAEKRIGAQMPLEEKKKFAHRIIDTSGLVQDTINQVYDIWNQITRHEKEQNT